MDSLQCVRHRAGLLITADGKLRGRCRLAFFCGEMARGLGAVVAALYVLPSVISFTRNVIQRIKRNEIGERIGASGEAYDSSLYSFAATSTILIVAVGFLATVGYSWRYYRVQPEA